MVKDYQQIKDNCCRLNVMICVPSGRNDDPWKLALLQYFIRFGAFTAFVFKQPQNITCQAEFAVDEIVL